jgi:hypothetical protein
MVVASIVMTPTLLSELGRRAFGLVMGGPYPLLPTAYLPALAAKSRFVTELHKLVPQISVHIIGGVFDVPYYNAMSATLAALDQVHGDLSGGERGFVAALARVTLDAPNGRTSLDSRHQAIAPNYLWQLQGRDLVPRIDRTISNVDPTFGGYFTAHDPPPSEATPACKRRTPPPWAR